MRDAMTVVSKLHEVDPGFRELCKTLFGGAVDPAAVYEAAYTRGGVSKMMPDASDVHVPGGLARTGRRRKPKPAVHKSVPAGARKGSSIYAHARVKANRAGRKAGKLIASGDLDGALSEARTGALYRATARGHVPGDRNDMVRVTERRVGKAVKPVQEVLDEIEKGAEADFTIFTEFSKFDSDKREVFGWASVVELNGQPVEDRQGDIITPEELERAAYSYVQKSRVGGHQHRREGDSPFHASDMIESLVLTREKVEKMGLPPTTPLGWWVGYKVHDDNTWGLIKKGELTGFSIHGRGRRVPIET